MLDNGQIIEFAAPDTLLADKNGVFNSMAKDAGLIINESQTTNGKAKGTNKSTKYGNDSLEEDSAKVDEPKHADDSLHVTQDYIPKEQNLLPVGGESSPLLPNDESSASIDELSPLRSESPPPADES